MDYDKIGKLIYNLRKSKNLTQQQVAELMNISHKTVSKWERGLGCPDVSLLAKLSDILGVTVESLLQGEIGLGQEVKGNMKKSKFYVCSQCGNIVVATSESDISCCGKKLTEQTPIKAQQEDKLIVEIIENEYFISSKHEMNKEHYILFVALLTGDSVLLRKQYPEWDLQTRIPRIGRGILVWQCSKHGLFYQIV